MPKKTPRVEEFEELEELDEGDVDQDVAYLRRTTDRRHKIDHDPSELNFDD